MFKLFAIFVMLTSQGPIPVGHKEYGTFETLDECRAAALEPDFLQKVQDDLSKAQGLPIAIEIGCAKIETEREKKGDNV